MTANTEQTTNVNQPQPDEPTLFCQRCHGPLLPDQPVTAWCLGLAGEFEHVTCPNREG